MKRFKITMVVQLNDDEDPSKIVTAYEQMFAAQVLNPEESLISIYTEPVSMTEE
jgi:hypothetical protein